MENDSAGEARFPTERACRSGKADSALAAMAMSHRERSLPEGAQRKPLLTGFIQDAGRGGFLRAVDSTKHRSGASTRCTYHSQADVKIDRDEPWIRAQPVKLGEHGKAGRGSREFFRSHPVNESLQGFASGLDSAGIPTHPRPRPASSARPMRSSGRVEQQMTRRPALWLHWP